MRRRLCITALTILLCSASLSARTTLEWWQFWTDPGIKPTIDSMVTEFEKANSDIEVNVTDLTWANGQEKIVISYASGTAPDIVELGSDWIAQFAANGHLADISREISSDSAQFDGWGMATYQDKVYGKPWILGTRVLFINRDLLVKAGYAEDWIPVTLQNLFDAAQQIDRLGDDIYGWGSNTAERHRLYKKFLPIFWSYGGELFTEDGQYCILSSERGIRAMRSYLTLHDSVGYVADQRGIEDAFLDGKIGFIISGDWLLKRIELEKRTINFGTSLFPGEEFLGKSFLGGEFLSVSERSSHKAEAMKFIDFMTSPENQVRFAKANRSANPSSKVAQKDPYFTSNPHLLAFVKQLKHAKHPPVDPNWPAIENFIEEAVEEAVFGSRLPATALRNASVKIMKVRRGDAQS